MSDTAKQTAALAPERRRRLISMLHDDGTVRVTLAAAQLGVSPSTVRRDLAALGDQGLVDRVHGGAAVAGHAPRLPARSGDGAERAIAAADAKCAIAAAAAKLVHDHMTVMLLAGTTVAAMLPFLADRRGLTIVTNNLDIAHALAHSPADHTLVVLGGMVHREQMTLVGTLAEQNLRSMHVDVMFGGAWGVDARLGVTGTKILLAGRRTELLEHADTVVVLADASKLGRTGPAQLAAPDQISRIITDAAAPADEVATLRSAGIVVEICDD